MQLKVSHKITLGFSFLVLSILVVGGGGLWGAATIGQSLDQITRQSLPTVTGSLKQMISLQQANLALLNVLSDDKDKGFREAQKKAFTAQIETFRQQLNDLQTGTELSAEQREQLKGAAETERSFSKAATQAMGLHEQRLQIDERVRQKESAFQRKTDTLNTWGQKYINQNSDSQRLTAIRGFLRAANTHRTQLINYRQHLDMPRLDKELKGAEGALRQSLNTLIAADASARRISRLVDDLEADLYGDKGMVALYREAYGISTQLKTTLADTHRLQKDAQQLVDSFIAASLEQAAQHKEGADEHADMTRMLIIALLVGNIVLAVVIAMLTVRAIHQPLADTVSRLRQLAQGDMRTDFNTERQDEFGDLARALNEVVAGLRHILQEITQGSERLGDVAESNAVTSRQTSRAMGQQSEQLTITASASEEMELMVQEVSQFARNTLEAVQNCEQLGIDADQHVQHTVASIQRQAEEISEAVSLSDQLNGYSQQIGSILDTIGDIANQTNLLALNAAIEAARAGDQGRGFAVVADEVRELARRTQNSTQEIQEMVENMQSSISNVVNVMQQSVKQTDSCVDYAHSSQRALLDMQEAIGNIRNMSTQITEATGQQNEAVEEMARTLEQINSAACETASGAEKVSTHSDDLLTISQRQQELINRFTV